MDEKFICDFYNTSTRSFKTVIETALSNLMDKSLIMYNKIIKVADKEKYTTRLATEQELELIMTIEKVWIIERSFQGFKVLLVLSINDQTAVMLPLI